MQDLDIDGATAEHSDSDSGESWTLLENSPSYGDVAPESPENAAFPLERENVDHCEKDEDDTDGISIISDSDPESSPCDLNDVKLPIEETTSTVDENTPLLTSPNTKIDGSAKEETDFLGDNVKYKTYVHKRNPKVSTILDIIMLGTFIITAGMALGHLWSCKNECTPQASVNKILSNLYKLQEENAYLRHKLKEISQMTSYKLEQRRKLLSNKLGNKQHRCKKIFEEPIMNDNMGEIKVKCVDDDQPGLLQINLAEIPEHEKEFINDVNKMKDIYERNKKWLDAEVKKQFEGTVNSKSHDHKLQLNSKIKSDGQKNAERQIDPTLIQKQTKAQEPRTEPYKAMSRQQYNLEQQVGPTYLKGLPNSKTHKEINLELQLAHHAGYKAKDGLSDDSFENVPEKKITYADSLKIDQPLQRTQKNEKNGKSDKWNKDHSGKKKQKVDEVVLILNSFSEDDIKKDDRYTGPKMKHEKKKHDRQKSHKKQKRQNKYEQWEMKGGYLKDFDEFSITSSLDNDYSTNKLEKRYLNPDFENYISKLIKTETNASNKNLPKKTTKFDERSSKVEKRPLKAEKGKKGIGRDSEWFNQRSAQRAEARLKLEQELFEENTSNNAAWYFRRMQKREQCRTQKDNSTFKKFSKRKMNFKMKR